MSYVIGGEGLSVPGKKQRRLNYLSKRGGWLYCASSMAIVTVLLATIRPSGKVTRIETGISSPIGALLGTRTFTR